MPQPQSEIEIFISHSSQDKLIAKALVVLLRAALDIPASQIRCTSVEGFKHTAGTLTEKQLRSELLSAKVFLGLITPISLQSTYVLFELGARWGADLPFVPLLAGGAKASILRQPLSDRNSLSCESRADLQQLVIDVSKVLGRSPGAAQTFQEQLDDLARRARRINPRSTPDALSTDVSFCILNKLSGKCLDLDTSATGGKKDGDRVHQWQFHGGTNQLWCLRRVEQQYFTIISKLSKRCLGVVGSNKKEGAKIQQSKYAERESQQWRIEKVEEDFYQIIARHSGLCLDVLAASHDDGAPIIQYNCHGGPNQLWQIKSVL
jgi:ricin-type beta-trefoil lectin protein